MGTHYPCPSATEVMTEANKIPDRAYKKMWEEFESYKEAYKRVHGEYPTNKSPNAPVYNDFREASKDDFNWIPGEFEKLTNPKLSAMQSILDAVRAARTAFDDGGITWIDTAKQHMGDGGWNGALANNFVNNFLTPMSGTSSIPENHKKIMDLFIQQMEASEAVFAAAHTDAKKLATQTLEALDAVTNKSGSDTKMGLVVLNAVVGLAAVALAPATGGMSIAAGLAINMSMEGVKAATQVGGEMVNTSDSQPLGADTVYGVIDNMKERLGAIRGGITAEEEKITKTLKTNYDNLVALRKAMNTTAEDQRLSSPVMPMQPKISAMKDDGKKVADKLD